MDNANVKYKDSIFRYLFKEPKNFIDVYEYISGQVLNENDIKPFFIESVIENKALKNDVSFITSDNKIIILTEHQSTICQNISFRMLSYYFELVNSYIRENKLRIHRRSALQLPKPELYVVYNGKEKLTETTISIAKNIGEHEKFKFELDIVDINFDAIKNKDTDNYLAGYSCLIDRIREYEAKSFILNEAIEQARKDCLQLGYLKGYLNRKEFLNMLENVYTIEQEIEDSKLDGIEQTKREIAIRMLHMNNNFEEISYLTQLSIEEIKLLKETLDKNNL